MWYYCRSLKQKSKGAHRGLSGTAVLFLGLRSESWRPCHGPIVHWTFHPMDVTSRGRQWQGDMKFKKSGTHWSGKDCHGVRKSYLLLFTHVFGEIRLINIKVWILVCVWNDFYLVTVSRIGSFNMNLQLQFKASCYLVFSCGFLWLLLTPVMRLESWVSPALRFYILSSGSKTICIFLAANIPGKRCNFLLSARVHGTHTFHVLRDLKHKGTGGRSPWKLYPWTILILKF
jgi:hypothetical protein